MCPEEDLSVFPDALLSMIERITARTLDCQEVAGLGGVPYETSGRNDAR